MGRCPKLQGPFFRGAGVGIWWISLNPKPSLCKASQAHTDDADHKEEANQGLPCMVCFIGISGAKTSGLPEPTVIPLGPKPQTLSPEPVHRLKIPFHAC